MSKKKVPVKTKQIDLLRKISPVRRFKIALQLSELIRKINLTGRKELLRTPNAKN